MTVRIIVYSFLSLALDAGLLMAATPARNSLPDSEQRLRTNFAINTHDAFMQVSEAVAHKSVVSIVTQIQRADYEGDRAALKRLYEDLAPFADDNKFGAKVHYWRGFAMWRRAIQGTSASATEIEQDLTSAVSEFEKAAAQDPSFIDAKVAAASCWQNLAALSYTQNDKARARELMQKSFPWFKEAEALQPDNPRFLWVLGAYRFYNPPERGGGQTFAIETYEKGLKAARQRVPTNDVLAPSWGEPELLMSLAFSNLNKTTPDLAAAERYAQQALALVPYWHYVRDLLLPQIRDAKNKK